MLSVPVFGGTFSVIAFYALWDNHVEKRYEITPYEFSLQ
jgi:hypothetical protein